MATGSNALALSMWWYPISVATNSILFEKSSVWGTIGPLALAPSAGTLSALATNSSAWDIFSNKRLGTYTLNSWNHIFLTRSASGVWNGYVNGTLGPDFPYSDARSLISNSYPITLGQFGTYTGCEWYMDEIGFWSGALGQIPTVSNIYPQYRRLIV